MPRTCAAEVTLRRPRPWTRSRCASTSEVYGHEHRQTLRVMYNLALDYGVNSDYAGARDLHRRTYILRSEPTSGATATEVLISWNGLARAVRLCGDYTEARGVGEDAYDYGRDMFGADNYWTLRTLSDLSIALRRIANAYNDALEMATDVFTGVPGSSARSTRTPWPRLSAWPTSSGRSA